MRSLITLLLLVALPTSLLAQDPPPKPLVEQGITITEEIVLSRELVPAPPPMEEPPSRYERKLFWLGLGIAATGAILAGLAVTSERESDLSDENPNTRLNVHLAPCGTDPADTTLPIADCKAHSGLLFFGLGLTAAGTGLAWYSLGHADGHRALVAHTVRF